MAMNLGASGKTQAVMNVTPLIDVLLVLLIIFMIITPLTPMGENALIPQPPKNDNLPDIVQPRTVVLQLSPDPGHLPALRINGQSTDWKDLNKQLKAIFDQRREKVMFVKADETLEWEPIANAIGIAHIAGVDNIGLVTARIEQAQK